MKTQIAAPRILVIRRRYLGDIVLLGPVWRSLRSHWPDAELTALVGVPYAPVVPLNSDVNHTIPFRDGAAGWFEALRTLRRSRFTHVLDLDNRPRTALLSFFSGATHRIALHHGPHVRFPRCYSQLAIAPNDFFSDHHISDYYLLALRELGIPTSSAFTPLQPPAEATAFVQSLPELAGTHAPRVLIHPGSRSPHRIWPADRFAAVIERLRAQGISSILVAGPGEESTVREIQSHLPQPAPAISRPLTIPQLAALFKVGGVLLCHDSGPMHLAAAVGAKVVALFSSQPVSTWRPLGEGHLTLQAPMPCNPCLSPNFCVPSDSYHNHCVRHLSVEQVLDAVLRQLPQPK